ncbi:hypothetical protein ACN6LC_004523 [Streptomyces violaceoruber]|uniref:hypothetical protein n=1 Tax=Streptomyces violaceoruber group TaxID=2867121 RepID=UPI0033E7C293
MAIKPWVGFGGGFSFDADSLPYAVEVQIRPGSACSNDAPTETEQGNRDLVEASGRRPSARLAVIHCFDDVAQSNGESGR